MEARDQGRARPKRALPRGLVKRTPFRATGALPDQRIPGTGTIAFPSRGRKKVLPTAMADAEARLVLRMGVVRSCSTTILPYRCNMLGSVSNKGAGGSSRILVADDHVIIRRGMRDLLHDHMRPCEVDEAGSCTELLSTLARKTFHLLMLDLQLGDGSALDLIEGIHQDHPDMRVLIYSMGAERIYAQRVLRMGCAGYLSKESGEEEVLRAVRTVLQGREYRSHELELRLLRPSGSAQGGPIPDPFSTLSDREVLVMEELLTGTGVKEIADKLGLQPTTVATYKARLFDKLGASNLLDLKRIVETHQRRGT